MFSYYLLQYCLEQKVHHKHLNRQYFPDQGRTCHFVFDHCTKCYRSGSIPEELERIEGASGILLL